MVTLGSANFGIILLLNGGCPRALYVLKLYCHGPIGTTEIVLHREVKSIVSFIQSVL